MKTLNSEEIIVKETNQAMEKPAILFVGHGSRDDEAVKEFYQLADHFRQRFPDRLVETGFLEFVRPMISEGIEKLVAKELLIFMPFQVC